MELSIIFLNAFLIVLPNKTMINSNNSSYIAMHLDRLSNELLSGTYGKQEESQKKKRKTESDIAINSSDDEKIKLQSKNRF